MRMTTGGIGIDKVSFTLKGMNIYGNEKFRDWGKDGLVVQKVLHPGTGQMTIVVGVGKKRVPNVPDASAFRLHQAYTAAESNLLPKFGLTDPIGVSMVDGKLNIVMPEAAKRAKLTRGRNKKTLEKEKAAAKPAAVSQPNTPPPAGHNNTIHRVMSDVRNGVQLPKELRPPELSEDVAIFEEVRNLIMRLNQLHDKAGGKLKAAPMMDGTFKALFSI